MSLAKSQDTRSIYQNQLYFYILAMNNWDLKFERIPSTRASKKMKHLGINLTKYMQKLCIENYKILRKESKKT